MDVLPQQGSRDESAPTPKPQIGLYCNMKSYRRLFNVDCSPFKVPLPGPCVVQRDTADVWGSRNEAEMEVHCLMQLADVACQPATQDTGFFMSHGTCM